MLVYLCRAKLPLNGLALPVHHAAASATRSLPVLRPLFLSPPLFFPFLFFSLLFNIPRRVITAAPLSARVLEEEVRGEPKNKED